MTTYYNPKQKQVYTTNACVGSNMLTAIAEDRGWLTSDELWNQYGALRDTVGEWTLNVLVRNPITRSLSFHRRFVLEGNGDLQFWLYVGTPEDPDDKLLISEEQHLELLKKLHQVDIHSAKQHTQLAERIYFKIPEKNSSRICLDNEWKQVKYIDLVDATAFFNLSDEQKSQWDPHFANTESPFLQRQAEAFIKKHRNKIEEIYQEDIDWYNSLNLEFVNEIGL